MDDGQRITATALVETSDQSARKNLTSTRISHSLAVIGDSVLPRFVTLMFLLVHLHLNPFAA